MRPIIVDLAEFLGNPVRSGIQRVIRELVANWPHHIPVVYARYDEGEDKLVHVPPRALQRALDYRPEAYASDEHAAVSRAQDLRIGGSREVELITSDKVLVPELFYGVRRVSFYRSQIKRAAFQPHFIVYDFIPWFKPEEVAVGGFSAGALMPYLALIGEAHHRCFISSSVRDDFVSRIVRDREILAGPVIKLGSDGIKIERQAYGADKKDMVCIGTLDGKKRQEIAFEAFLRLPPDQRGRFVCLGKVPSKPAPWMRPLLNCEFDDVEIVDSPSEHALASRLRLAKATVFISTNEGFGLPAVESLFRGIPLLAHERLPSLADLPREGQIRIDPVSVDTVSRGMHLLADDREVRRLWSEVSNLNLPTWHRYAVSIAEWLSATESLGDVGCFPGRTFKASSTKDEGKRL